MGSKDAKKAWGKLSGDLSGLSKKVSKHMKDGSEAAPDEKPAKALDRFTAAVDRTMDSASKAFKDPEIRGKAKMSGQHLTSAVRTTANQAVDGVKGLGNKSPAPTGSPVPPPSAANESAPTGNPVSPPSATNEAAPTGDPVPDPDDPS